MGKEIPQTLTCHIHKAGRSHPVLGQQDLSPCPLKPSMEPL